jgi:xylulokinase
VESADYGIRYNMEDFLNNNQHPSRIVAVGGGVNYLPMIQIVCDICNISQEIPEIKVGICYGDAFLAALGIGLYSSRSDAKKWTKIEKVITPNPEAHEKSNEFFEIYKELYPINKDLMHRISMIQNR